MRTFFFLSLGAAFAMIPSASTTGKVPMFNFLWLGFCLMGLLICGALQSGFGQTKISKLGEWLNEKKF